MSEVVGVRIESLKYFVVTADCRSMTLSSKVLHVSQQCISKEIKQLEEELGRKVFWRSKAGVALTEDGTVAYNMAVQILQQFAGFAELFREPSLPQTLTIGYYNGFMKHVESIVNIFQSTHPQIVVEEYFASTGHLEQELNGAAVDLVLQQVEKDAMAALEAHPKYELVVLLEEKVQAMFMATPANAQLNGFNLEWLADYPILFYCDSTQEIPLYQRIAQRYCSRLNVLYKGNNIEKSWNVFERKNAVALMTKSLGGMMHSDLPTRLVPLDQEILVCTVLLVKKDLLQSAEIAALIDIFRAFFQQYS